MKTIGFANQYYTLWNVTKTKVAINPFQVIERSHFTYIQNLSKDLEKAKEKISGDFVLDLELRGDVREFYTDGEPSQEIPESVFKFGKYIYQDITSCKDFDYVKWYYSETDNEFALEVLLKNGFELVDGILYDLDDAEKQKHYLSLKRGHLFENKKRVELKIKTIKAFGFEGYYGYTFIRVYETECGKEVKYMGSNPPEISYEVFEAVKATIKHDNYNGVDETKLQRISLL